MTSLLQAFITEALALDEDGEELDEEELDEFSGVAALGGGVTLPLGMAPGKPSEPYVPKSRGLGSPRKKAKP